MPGHSNHSFVSLQFRQVAGIDAVDFKKIQSGLDPGAFSAIKVGLAFGKVEGVGGGNLTEIAATVTVYVLRLGYSRFQPIFVAKTMQSAPGFNLIPMNRVDLRAVRKIGSCSK